MSEMPPGAGEDPTRRIQPADYSYPSSSAPGSVPPADPTAPMYPPAAPGGYPQQGAQPGYPAYPPADTPGYPQPSSAPPSSPAPAYPPATQQGYQQPGYQQPGYQQAGYQQAGYQQAGYQQPGYQQPVYTAQPQYDPQGRPYSDKSKLVAGLLGIFLGGFGVGRFYTGHTGIAVGQLVVSICTFGIGALWGLVDGILILVNGGTDAQGRVLRD